MLLEAHLGRHIDHAGHADRRVKERAHESHQRAFELELQHVVDEGDRRRQVVEHVLEGLTPGRRNR